MRMLAVFLAGALFASGAYAQRRAPYDHPPNEASFRALMDAADEPDRDVRARAVWVLGRIGDEEALPVARRLAAEDPAEAVRIEALRALANLLEKGGEIEFKMDVEQASPAMRFAALEAAARFRFRQRDALVARAWERGTLRERAMAVRALALAPVPGKDAILQEALESGVPAFIAEAALSLAAQGDPASLGNVLELMAHRDFEVRAAACQGLAFAKFEQGLPALQRACADPHYIVRRAAIRALVEIGDPETVGAIQGRIAEDDYTVRVVACEALGQLITPSSPPYLASRLADEVVEVRQAAEAALLLYPADMAYAAVMEYGGTEYEAETRHRAWMLLGEYGHEGTRELAFQSLEDSSPTVRGYAMRIMRKLGDRRSIPHIRRTLRFPHIERATEVDIEECFAAAVLFELDGFENLATRLLRLYLNPPETFTTTDAMALGSIYYLASRGHEASAPLVRQVLEEGAWDYESLKAMGEVLEKLVGFAIEPPPERDPRGRYFIHVEAD